MTPGILPLPPRRGGALPLILVLSLILCILEATQGCQRFFEVKAMPQGHRVRTNKNSNVSTNCYGVCWVLLLLQCGPRSPICPSLESLLQCDPLLLWSFGTMYHERTDRECSRIVVSYATFGVDSQCDILDNLSFRIGDRVVDLSWSKKFGIEKKSRTDLMYFLFSVISSRKKWPHVH